MHGKIVISKKSSSLYFCRPTTRPLINKQNNDGFKVETPRQIMIQFDQIAYAKGGSILRMMQHVITEETWVDGMRPYLNQNKVR